MLQIRKWLLTILMVLGGGILLLSPAVAAAPQTIQPHMATIYITQEEAEQGISQTLYVWSSRSEFSCTASSPAIIIKRNGVDVLEKGLVTIGASHVAALQISVAVPDGLRPADQTVGTITFKDRINNDIYQVNVELLTAERTEPAEVTAAAEILEMTSGDSALVPVSLGDRPVSAALQWRSTDPDVVAVDANTGVMTAKNPGTATIRVTAGSKSDTLAVTVFSAVKDVFSADTASVYLQAGEEQDVMTLLRPAAATTAPLAVKGPAAGVITIKQSGMPITDSVTYNTAGEAEMVIGLPEDFDSDLADSSGKVGSVVIGSERSEQAVVEVYLRKPQGPAALEKIMLDQTALTLHQGETALVGKTLLPLDAADRAVTWSSSEPETVAVNAANGLITALKPGKATITIQAVQPYAKDKYAMSSLLVSVPSAAVDTISCDDNDIRVTPEVENVLHFTLKPAQAKSVAVTVKGDYANKLSIGGVTDGALGFNGAGQGILSVELTEALLGVADGTILAEITVGGEGCIPAVVNVRYQAKSQPLTNILLTKNNLNLEKGKTYQAVPVLKPANATDLAIKWQSSDEMVATVDNGLITAKSPGEAEITVTAQTPYGVDAAGGALYASASLKVQVYELLPEEAMLRIINDGTGDYQDVGNGETVTLAGARTLTLQLGDVIAENNEEIVWSCDTAFVASVTADKTHNGQAVLRTIRPGTAVIRARGAVSGQSFSFTIKVTAVEADGIAIFYNDDNYTDRVLPPVAKGREINLEARLLPDTATPVTITWTSSDRKVASINNSGLLKINSDSGTAVITATAKVNGKTIKAQTRFEGGTTQPFEQVTVWRTDSSGLPAAPNGAGDLAAQGATLVDTSQIDGVTTFENKTTTAAPLVLATGSVHYFRVRNGMADSLSTDSAIHWITPLSGLVTVKTTPIAGSQDLLMKVTVTNSAKKATGGQLARIVATNVGNYQHQGDTSTYTNYPELLIKLDAPAPDALTITNVPKVMSVGETCTLRVKGTPSNRDETVTWESSDTDVATIDPNTGLITAKGRGTRPITITATSAKNPTITAQTELTVDYKVSALKLNANNVTLNGRETFQLNVSVQPYGVLLDTDNVTFESRDPYIAEVTDTGLVSLYSPNTAQPKEYTYIDVWANGQKRLSCKVTVGSQPLVKPELAKVSVTSGLPLDDGGNHLLVLKADSKAKQLTYVIKGLTNEQKKRVTMTWNYQDLENGPRKVLGSNLIYVDNMGYVSRKDNPPYNQARVEATFFYEGEQIGEPLLYTVRLQTKLTADVGHGFVDTPGTITELARVGDTKTFIVNATPPGDDITATGLVLKPTSAFNKYLSIEEDTSAPVLAGQVAYTVTVTALPTKATTVSLTVTDNSDKLSLKFKLPSGK